LVDLVEGEDQRFAETGQPAQFGILCTPEIGCCQIDHGMRTQGLVASQLFAQLARHLAAAGHVGNHQLAAIRQAALGNV
jgi:hypothetical protein